MDTSGEAKRHFLHRTYAKADKMGHRLKLDKKDQAIIFFELMHMFVREIDDIDDRLRILRKLEKWSVEQIDATRNQIAVEIMSRNN
jgi:hypothetical protein